MTDNCGSILAGRRGAGEATFLQKDRGKSRFNQHCSSERQLKVEEQIKIKGSLYVQGEGREHEVAP